jgi:DNA-binding transcriptional ArsR family regulator
MSNVPPNAISEQQDKVFRALASHHRRAILDVLRDQPLTTGMLCAQVAELDRCSVMQHLKVLEGADLIIVERRGRQRWNHLNPLPIHAIHERWIGPHAERAVAMLAKLKRDLEKA